nr:hypothetical protein [uncultured Prevotella sp.]
MTLGAGFRLCLRGGSVNNGGQCGLSTLNDNNDVSNANVNYGAALNFLDISPRGVVCSHIETTGSVLAPWRYIHINKTAGR